MKKFLLLLLSITFIFLTSCNVSTTSKLLRVMVEDGDFYHITSSKYQDIEYGASATFDIVIDEGCTYYSNNAGATFENGVLSIDNVKTNKTISLDVRKNVYNVIVHKTDGLSFLVNEERVNYDQTFSVVHGSSIELSLAIDDNKEFYSITNADSLINLDYQYSNSILTISSIKSNLDISIQLRNKSIIKDTYTIRLLSGEGYTIEGESELVIERGEDATFSILLDDDYEYYSNNCGATYLDGVISFSNVESDQDIIIYTRKKNTTSLYFSNGRLDIFSDNDTRIINAYPNYGYIFSHYLLNDKIYSYANNLKISEEIDAENIVPIFTSVDEYKALVRYHANGGNIKDSTDELINYVFDSPVYLYPASLGEWGYKSFYREGYLIKEYNTLPDGSGKSYSLGSRVFEDNKEIDLYLIWIKESNIEDFEYEYILDNHQNKTGIKLTNYKGNDSVLVIPSYIEDLEVKIIDSSFLTNNSLVNEIYLSNTIIEVKNNAFNNLINFTTLHMTDRVEIIHDSSFVDCPLLKNLRINAYYPPMGTAHLIGTTIRRFEILNKNKNSDINYLLFYGGSSTFQGIDGKTINDRVSERGFTFLNCAQNAYISGCLMLELFSYFMDYNDLMVFIPEYGQTMMSNILELPVWYVFETYYDLLKFIDIRDYERFFDSYYDYMNGSSEFTFGAKIEAISNNETVSYLDYNDTVDEFFTRAENFEIIHYSLEPRTPAPNFQVLANIVETKVERIYEEKYFPYSIRLYFAHVGMWENAFECESELYGDFANLVKTTISFPYISNYLDHLFSIDDCTDSVSHLTREAAIIHSNTLVDEIFAQLDTVG